MPEETSLQIQLQNTVTAAYKAVVGEANPTTVIHTNPERWCKVAALLMQGKAPTAIRNQFQYDYRMIKRVEAQLLLCPEVTDFKKEMQTRYAQAITTNLELMQLAADAVSDKYEEDPEAIKDQTPKDMHDNQWKASNANKDLMHTLLRLRGDTPDHVKITHEVPAFDQMMEELKKARAKEEEMAPAEQIIDVREE